MSIKINYLYKEIQKFKDKLYENYKIKVHIFFDETELVRLTLEDLESILILKLKKNYPDFKKITYFRNTKSRKYHLVLYSQLFSYIANKKYNYSKSEIARYMAKDHSTVIHSIKSINNYFDTDHKLVKELYNEINEYVGLITKNTRI